MTFNVRDFGAAGDGQTDDTGALRAAIAACVAAGGGRVCLPPGRYVSGTLRLGDGVTLHVDAGAELCEAFTGIEPVTLRPGVNEPHFIIADGVRGVGLTGGGTIRGQGHSTSPGDDRRRRGFRSGLIFLRACEGVRVSDLRIADGDAWTLHLDRCTNVFIRGVELLNQLHRIGGNDGIDVNSCRNVHISDCHIEAWDDCIVLKTLDTQGTGSAPPCENVVVSNCTLVTGCTALKLGSESVGDFRDIHFANCTVNRSSVGLGIYLLDGATVERVTWSQISMGIVPDARYRPHGAAHNAHLFPVCIYVDRRTEASRLGRLRDLVLRDIAATASHGMVIQGHPDSPIENLTLENVGVRVERAVGYVARQLPCSRGLLEDRRRLAPGATGSPGAGIEPASDAVDYLPAYVNVGWARDLRMSGVTVRDYPAAAEGGGRAGIALTGVERGVVRDCTVRGNDGGAALPVQVSDDCCGVAVSPWPNGEGSREPASRGAAAVVLDHRADCSH